MDLIERALKISIGIRVALGIITFLMAIPGTPSGALGIFIGAAILGVAYVFRHHAWCLILLGIICFFDFFGAIAGGLFLTNIFGLIDGVLSFIILCGIAIWFKERNEAGNLT